MHFLAMFARLALLAAFGGQEATPAPVEGVTLTVTFERSSGDPLVGARTSLWAGEWTPGSVVGSSVVLRGTTDSSGAVTFQNI